MANEIAGLGFGGSLLHLLRLGSMSSLSVVQARATDRASWAAFSLGLIWNRQREGEVR